MSMEKTVWSVVGHPAGPNQKGGSADQGLYRQSPFYHRRVDSIQIETVPQGDFHRLICMAVYDIKFAKKQAVNALFLQILYHIAYDKQFYR